METFTPKFRRDPNAKVDHIYQGVSPGGRTVTKVVKRHPTEDRLETTRTYGPGLARGQGGMVATIVLGGMEATLDEVEYILEAQRQKPFTPRRSKGEIVQMCQLLQERRNERIKYLRKNPSEVPKKKPVRLHLPVGFRYVGTETPGLKVLARI